MFHKILSCFTKHKFITAIIIIIIIAGAYFAIKSLINTGGQTSYVLAAAEKGTIVVSVSGSGQVSASNQLDVTSKVSSNVTAIKAEKGQEVKEGDILATLDAKDASASVRDAQMSLESAQLSLEKLQRGSTESEITSAQLQVDSAEKTLLQSQNDLETAKTKASVDLANDYEDTKAVIQNIYNNMYDAINRQLDSIYSNNSQDNAELSFLTSDQSAANDASSLRLDARQSLKKIKDFLDDYPSDYSTIDGYLSDVSDDLDTIQKFFSRLGDAVNSGITTNTVTASTLSGYKSTISSLKTSVNSSLSSITSQERAISTQKTTNHDNVVSAENKVDDAKDSLIKAKNSLADLQAGTDALDLKSQELQVTKAKISLGNASEKLADYTIKAPFDGVIANVNVKKGDTVSASTAIVTLITKQQIAEVTLGEVDAANVRVGQKATLTFDAIADLSITGKVIDIDAIGTVSQGVVSYTAKIGLDTQNENIKPGMSVSASIITNSSQDVITVPSSAIKTSGDSNYVEVLTGAVSTSDGTAVTSNSAPVRKQVEIGVSDDSYTEIISGLSEGDQVIIKTIAASSGSSTKQASSLLQLFGGGNRSSVRATSNSSSGTTSKTNSASKTTSGSLDMGGPPPGM